MEYTVSINVEERWSLYLNEDDERTINYDTIVLVDAADIESAEQKVIDWFDRQDSKQMTYHVSIIRTIPKIH